MLFLLKDPPDNPGGQYRLMPMRKNKGFPLGGELSQKVTDEEFV